MTDYLQFVYPAWLYALPLLVVMAFLRKRRGADGSIAHPTARFVEALARPSESLAGRIGALLTLLAAMCLLVALARPQLVNEREVRNVSGIDIVVAFDLSGSMSFTDMRSQGTIASRLNAAKFVISKFIETRPDDRIGIVGFAGKTKSLCPLTLDHALAIDIIQNTTVATQYQAGTINAPGTAIGSAIAASASRLEARKETKSKIIILVTDGASNVGKISPIEAATSAAKLGIRIYTIAVGTDSPQTGNTRIAGNEFDEETLIKIASMTGGEHFRATDTNKLQLAFSSIDKLEKTEVKINTIKTEKELFIYFLIASTILLATGLALQVLRPNPAP